MCLSKGALTSVNLKDAFEEKMIEDRVFKTETDFLDNRREDINKRIEESKEINFTERWNNCCLRVRDPIFLKLMNLSKINWSNLKPNKRCLFTQQHKKK